MGVGVGLLLGDAHCAPYEGGPLERGLWWLIGRSKGKQRYTDDSQMAFDLGNHLLKAGRIDQKNLAIDFASSYKWSRGYGPSTVAVLKQIKKGKDWQSAATHRYKDGSFGNGAAMRIPILSVFLHKRVRTAEIMTWAKQSAEVTHPNPKAIDGATAIAICINNALDNVPPKAYVESVINTMQTPAMLANIKVVAAWLSQVPGPSVRQAKKVLGAGTAAIESCPVAIYIALMGIDRPFDVIIKHAIEGGGDTDTIGAMAGAIWGAYNGYEKMSPTYINMTEGVDAMQGLISKLRANHPAIQ